MAIIGDFGGTSNFSFSINGKVTLFQGDDIPDDLMGNDGDVYFKSEGLIYVKRNGTWLTNDPEDLKWIPDPRLHQNTLLYSNGENYDNTKITYNTTEDDPYQIELYKEPKPDDGTTSMIVPNIGWINRPGMNNLLHRTDNETKNGILTLKSTNGIPLVLQYSDTGQYTDDVKLRFGERDAGRYGWLSYSYDFQDNRTAKFTLHNGGYVDVPMARCDIELISKLKNNNYYTYATAPTPNNDASSNEIITAEWFNYKYNALLDEINELKNYVDQKISELRDYVIEEVNNVKVSVMGYPNLTSTEKVEISGTDNITYVATKNGWVVMTWNEHAIYGGWLKINGVVVGGQSVGGGGDWGNSNHNVMYPVKKGDVISKERNWQSSFIFYPNY